jgi:gamma-glutamylcysteine synthetase
MKQSDLEMAKIGFVHLPLYLINSQPNLTAYFNKVRSYAKQLRSFDKPEAPKPKESYLKIGTRGDYYQRQERT